MHIKKSGFVNISHINDEKIIIGKNLQVILFDENIGVQDIILEENAELDYFGYFSGNNIYEKRIMTTGNKSNANVNCFLLGRGKETVTAKIVGEIADSYSKIDSDIVSLVQEAGKIDLDGIIQINENIQQGEGYLDETNIFLGEQGNIRAIPRLLVRSNDVKASHGCNIEKVSDEKLFYLRSRGLERENALFVMIKSYIKNIFGKLESTQKELYDDILEKILKEIK